MDNKKIAQVVVGLPIEGPFDYMVVPELRSKAFVGCRVEVPFGHQQLQGIIVGLKAKSSIKTLKPLTSILDVQPLIDATMLELTKKISEHYGCSWGEALEASLPDFLRKGKQVSDTDLLASVSSLAADMEKTLNQPSAEVPANKAPDLILIHDLGRSKRWTVVLDKIRQAFAQKQGVLFLIPEIAMIDGIEHHLKEALKIPITVLDKQLTEKQELKEWLSIKTNKFFFVIGSRSAVFAPVHNLGLIIVWDEENPAYKQEQVPYYHVRDVVLMRVSIEKLSVVFVSATPSLDLWYLVSKKKLQLVSFPVTQYSQAIPVDLTNYNTRKSSIISFPLRNHIEKNLSCGKRVVLFMNRRGFSFMTRCYQCGYSFKCERCDTNLSYSYAKKKMICRHCHSKSDMPSVCPKCQNRQLRSIGTGIEKLESEMARIFPQARIQTFDGETQQIPSNFDILIATQAVLRIQDKISVELIGCVYIDSELNRHDLRASERTFSLLVQLRTWAKEKLVIQTRLLDNDCIQAALKMDYKSFYREEMKIRRDLGFPPFRHLVEIHFRSVKEESALEQSYLLYVQLGNILPKGIDMLDPQADIQPKLRDKYRFIIVLKGKATQQMLAFIKKGLKGFKRKAGVIIMVNVDPY